MIDGHDRIYFSDDAQTLSTAAAIGFIIRFCIGGGGQEFPTAVLAAEVGCLSIAFGVESGGGVDGHAADGIDCFGFGCVHVGFVCFNSAFDFTKVGEIQPDVSSLVLVMAPH
jgi:hypothetical protein